MKVGDLVACNHPHRRMVEWRSLGLIIENVQHNNSLSCRNKMFNVIWCNGRVDHRLWDYDLKVISESR